jgi:preprotein translocase subunit SecF
MKLFSKVPQFDFMGKRKVAMIISAALILISIVSLAVQGLKLGIDFTGGTLIEVGYEQPADLEKIRSQLSGKGYNDMTVQFFGTNRDVLIRLAPQEETTSAKISDDVIATLNAGENGKVDLRRVEFVGPQVGEELTEDGGLAMLYALIFILIYVGFRFEYRFALGSIFALIHDVTITIGMFSVLQVEFDLPVLAAVLAVIGYSLNDTIVVFDRIRENFRKMRKGDAVSIINASLNQTLSRTLMTSFTTMLVLFALFLFGGEIIHGFAFALLVGIFVGTYSSIYVASASAVSLGVSKTDLMPVEKEGDVDDRP